MRLLPLSPGVPHLLHVTRAPRSFTALCGGVDSGGWAAAAADDDEGPVGVRSAPGDPLIERLIFEFGG